jgi:hypothetical protein
VKLPGKRSSGAARACRDRAEKWTRDQGRVPRRHARCVGRRLD